MSLEKEELVFFQEKNFSQSIDQIDSNHTIIQVIINITHHNLQFFNTHHPMIIAIPDIK